MDESRKGFLGQSFLRFANAVVSALNGPNRYCEVKDHIEFTARNQFIRGPLIRPAYKVVVEQLLDSGFWTTSEAKDCVRAHFKAGAFKSFPAADLQAWPQLTKRLTEPLLRCLDVSRGQDVDERKLLDIYFRYLGAWTGEIYSQMTVPILNIEGGVGIKFEDFELAPFSMEEKNAFAPSLLYQDLISIDSVSRCTYQIKSSLSATQEKVAEWESTAPFRIQQIITSLRLAVAGQVGAQAVFFDNEGCGSSGRQSLFHLKVSPYSEKYVLDASTAAEALRIYKLLSTIQREPSSPFGGELEIALRRFNQAYTRDIAEDRIIDLTIALESTLLSRIHNELNYRMAFRGACLLADEQDPEPTFSLLQKIYNERSKIVHDGWHLRDRTLPLRCEEVVRRILRAYLVRVARGESLGAINKDIESRVISTLRVKPRASG